MAKTCKGAPLHGWLTGQSGMARKKLIRSRSVARERDSDKGTQQSRQGHRKQSPLARPLGTDFESVLAEACELLGISRETLRRLRLRGVFQPGKHFRRWGCTQSRGPLQWQIENVEAARRLRSEVELLATAGAPSPRRTNQITCFPIRLRLRGFRVACLYPESK